MDYQNTHFTEQRVRNAYLEPEEIEVRQLAELHQLAEDWQNKSLPIWDVMWRLEHVMGHNSLNCFGSTIKHNKYGGGADYPPDDRIASERAKLSQYIKPEFLSEPTDNLRKSITDFVKAIEQRDNLSSFDIARSIVDAVLLKPTDFPSPPKFSFFYSTLHEEMIGKLREDEERLKEKSKPRVTGTLTTPQSEEQVLAYFAPYIAKMREGWETEGCPQLIESMVIDASGSGQIKPMRYNPNYVSGKQGGKKANFFDPYRLDSPDEGSWVEDIYGTTVATITTYSITFEPHSPEQLEVLASKVKKALHVIGAMPPCFGIPVSWNTKPYERPFTPVLDLDEINDKGLAKGGWPRGEGNAAKSWPYDTPSLMNRSWATERNCDIVIKDGKVQVHSLLDLDDTYALYYLLEHTITPSAGIAHALNAARYNEARSAPETMAGLDSDYSTSNLSPQDQLGNLSSFRGGDAVVHALEDVRSLYYGKQINETQLLSQVMAIVAQTLDGNIKDWYGAFPQEKQLHLTNAGNDNGARSLTTREVFLKQRTIQFLNIVAGLPPDSDTAVANALFQQAARMTDDVRKKWRQNLQKREREYVDKMLGDSLGSLDDMRETLKGKEETLNISDIISGYAERNKSDQNGQSKPTELTTRTGLVVRDSNVPPCADRAYPDTIYTSRLKGSIWPRKELPSALQPYVEPESEPNRAAVRLLLSFGASTLP